MIELRGLTCEVCRTGAPQATEEEMVGFMAQIPDWQVVEEAGEKQLLRAYKFKNFRKALAFTNLVGEIAEEAGHHPALLTEWGMVTVRWWTHKINGLHKNDFVMAAKTDQLLK